MICRMTGHLAGLADDHVRLAVGALEYEVLIPEFVRRRLQGEVGREVTLHTIQYLEGNPAQGRLIPRLVGFQSEVEREFFELFCSVDGVGARKALRAMVRPVQDVAVLIEEQDADQLKALPGIGAATADRIIAKLRRKMSRFALLVSPRVAETADVSSDLLRDTFDALCVLGHSEADARKLVDRALASGKKPKDVQGMLQLIYQLTHSSSDSSR